MKVCCRCKVGKPDFCFPTVKGNSIYCCRDCKRIYDRAFWAKNKSRLNSKKKINSEKRKDKVMAYIANYLKEHPCIDCGEANIVVLEFDHVTGDKLDSISQLVIAGSSLENIKTEIDKCVVRCANCHRFKTAKDRGYKILKYL